MNRSTRNTLFVTGFLAASAAFLGIAHAKGEGCEGGFRKATQHGEHRGDPAARAEERLARLKTDLKITPQQEPLWQAFAEKSKNEAGKGMQAMRDRLKDDTPASAPERMARMQTVMKERVAAMDSVNESFKRLYDALSPEQKALADKHFSRAGHGGHGPKEPRKG